MKLCLIIFLHHKPKYAPSAWGLRHFQRISSKYGSFYGSEWKPWEKLWVLLIQTSSSAHTCGWPFEVWAADLLLEQNGFVPRSRWRKASLHHLRTSPLTFIPAQNSDRNSGIVKASVEKALKKPVQSPVNWDCKALPPVCGVEWTAQSESQNINATPHKMSVQERQC